MPNHVHGIIIIIESVGAKHASPLQKSPHGPKPRSCGAMVGSFKSTVTKRINEIRGKPGESVWQRNYYEHIIRNENELLGIREYIVNNPCLWAEDEDNPNNLTKHID